MPFRNDAADPRLVRLIVDRPPVLTVHEEGGLGAVGLQKIEDFVGIDEGAIIKAQREGSGHGALSDDPSHRDGGRG